MSEFPLKFEVYAKSKEGITCKWQSGSENYHPIEMSIPCAFNGPGKAYSPEDLFGLAMLNCIIAVYKDICEKNKIKFETIDGKASIFMDRSQEGNGLIISTIDITIKVTGASDREKARIFLEKTLKICPIANSIKSGKSFHITVE